MSEMNPRGRFVWHELMTADPEAAIKFYPAVTGWGVMPFDQDPSYRMWIANGAPIGGVMAITSEAKAMGAGPQWLPYIGTADVHESTRHAVRLGAKPLVRPTQIVPGTYSVLLDPQGARFALFQATGNAPGHEGVAEVGEFSWHELRTTDGVAAWAFYKELCGWNETTAMDLGPDGKYQMFGRNGVELGGIYNKPDRVEGPPAWLCYVRTASTDRSIARSTALGGSVVSGPMAVPGGNYIAELRDAQGVGFALHEERETMRAAVPAKVKAKARAKAKAKAQPKAKAKTQLKAKAKPKAKPKARAKTKVKARAKRRSPPRRKRR